MLTLILPLGGRLRLAFGRSCGDPADEGRADRTDDRSLDVVDCSLLRGNFAQSAPAISA